MACTTACGVATPASEGFAQRGAARDATVAKIQTCAAAAFAGVVSLLVPRRGYATATRAARAPRTGACFRRNRTGSTQVKARVATEGLTYKLTTDLNRLSKHAGYLVELGGRPRAQEPSPAA